MEDPKEDELAKIQSEVDNAWIKELGRKYDPEAEGLSPAELIYFNQGVIPIPPNLSKAHRKELKRSIENTEKGNKKYNEEEKAKAESLIWIFAGLGMILFVIPFFGICAWLNLDNKAAFKNWGTLTIFSIPVCLWYGIKWIITPISAVGERGNANRSALMLIGFFLLILVVVVFGTILVLK